MISAQLPVVGGRRTSYLERKMAAAIKSYRDLEVWQKGMELVTLVYQGTASFPREELFGITSQMRRAAVSIPANIAEGQGRAYRKDFLNFLSMAYGSLMELETHLLVALNLSYLQPTESEVLLNKTSELGRMLNGLMRSLNVLK
jgi:four helix bundle protein